MNEWIVVTYKIKELEKLLKNLKNQDIRYYIEKINLKKINTSPKVVYLFPGYIFIFANTEQYKKISYTKGIKNIISFNNKIAKIEEEKIFKLKKIENNSYDEPITEEVFIGQKAVIPKGPFKGSLIEITAMPKKERITVLLSILGAKRKISAGLDKINF